jgi:hopene-associated glycosyltransferase HpnB
VTVVDDRSSDGTASVARSLAAGAEVPVGILEVDHLPAGWTGKVHALAEGWAALRRRSAEDPSPPWVFLTDADILHPADGVARFVAQAARGPFDLVSVMARLRTETFWEKLLAPTFVWFFQAMYPFRASSDPASKVASAAGGAVLVRADVLERAGAFIPWRDATIDDLALARHAKDAGARLWTGFADDIVSTRACPTLRSFVDMVARSAFEELRRRAVLVPVVWLALLLAFVVPPAATAAGVLAANAPLLVVGAAGWFLLLVQVLPSFRHHRVPAPFALLVPLAAVLYAWMTTVSAWRHLRGTRTPWRSPAPQ